MPTTPSCGRSFHMLSPQSLPVSVSLLPCRSRQSVIIDWGPEVIVALVSDRIKLRGVIMLFTLPVAIVGYAVIANVHNPKVQYGMTFLMATGMYASVPCILVWNSNNSAGHYKRATTSAMQLAIANCGGFVASMKPPRPPMMSSPWYEVMKLISW